VVEAEWAGDSAKEAGAAKGAAKGVVTRVATGEDEPGLLMHKRFD